MKKIAKKSKNVNKKAFKAGGYSLVICAVSLVVVILLNLIISALPSKYTEIDISSNDLYSISDYTKEIVNNVDDSVTIYHIATNDNIDKGLTTLLSRYTDLNSKIKVEVRDPEISQIASQYTDTALSENSLIFVSDKRSKVVDGGEIYEYSDEMQQYLYYGYEVYPDIFDGESEITSALDFVTTDVLPVVYSMTGHGEYTVVDAVKSEISNQNIELKDLDLVIERNVPDDCECLLLLSPSVDISEKELSAVLEYLKNGGRIFITTLCSDEAVELPNFSLLLEEYGLTAEDGMIIEGDESGYYYSPNYIIPTVSQHEITAPVIEKGYHVFLPIAQSIKEIESYRSSLSVEPLFTTSDKAFLRTDFTNSSIEKSDSDISGQFNLGFVVSETVGNNETKAVVLSTPYFLDEGFVSYTGNLNLFLNSIKWMCGLDEKISVVEAKSLSSGGALEVSDSSGLMLSAVVTVVVPLVLLVFGIVIFVRRKKH